MIFDHLVYVKPSLLACSLTCYSWYIAAVPHLHHTLIVPPGSLSQGEKSRSPKVLLRNHELGLLPLVKVLWICGNSSTHVELPQKLSNRYTLRPFFALSNVCQLEIEYLDIPSFMPRIRRYFGHFMPTLRYLILEAPKGSNRQIVYFIGLFQHLDDLKLVRARAEPKEEPTDDLTLIPPFVPPLRGWLILVYFTRVGILKDMIDLFGGIRFRCMRFCNVNGIGLLLNACAETLELVDGYPTDHHGTEVSLGLHPWLTTSQLVPPTEALTFRETNRFRHS